MTSLRTACLALAITFAAAGAFLSCDSGPRPTRAGKDVYVEVGCVNCHGFDGAGMKGFAPTLHQKKQFWTRETLIAYVKDPQVYAKQDPRLREQGKGYSLPMPKAVLIDPVEYERLADYVLAMP